MSLDWQDKTENIFPLLDAVIENIPAAPHNEGTPQMQITSLDYSKFVGRIAIGQSLEVSCKKAKIICFVKQMV